MLGASHKAENARRYRIGGMIAAQLTPVVPLNVVCKHFGLSKNRVLQIEREALYKIAKRMSERLGWEIKE